MAGGRGEPAPEGAGTTNTEEFDDDMLDGLLAGLGTPPAAVPSTSAAQIIERAALLAPAAVAAHAVGVALNGKTLLLLVLGSSMLFGAGWMARGLTPPPVVERLIQVPVDRPVEVSVALQGPPVVFATVATAAEVETRVVTRWVHVEVPAQCEDDPADALVDAWDPFESEPSAYEPPPPDPEAALWPEDPGETEPSRDTPPPQREPAPSTERLLSSEPTVQTPRRSHPRPVAQVEVGAAGGLDAWRVTAPPIGTAVRAGLGAVGPNEPVAPQVRGNIELALLPGTDDSETRFAGGVDGSGGIVLGGKKARFDVGWAGGMRVMPAPVGEEPEDNEEVTRIFGLTGPQLGLTVGPAGGTGFRAGLSVMGTVLDLNGDGTFELLPWASLTVGAEFGLPPKKQ